MSGNKKSAEVKVAVKEIDITPLVTKIGSPTPNSIVSGAVTIFGTATNTNFSNYTVKYGTGSSPAAWHLIAASDARVINGSLTVWNTSVIPDGTWTLLLEAMDKSGNMATSSVTIILDNTLPTSTIILPVDNADILQGTITVMGSVDDEHLLGYILEYVNAQGSYTQIANGTTKIASGTLGAVSLSKGTYTLRLTVRDVANNVAVHKIGVKITEAMSTPEEILGKVAENYGRIRDMRAEMSIWGSVGSLTVSPYYGSIFLKMPDKSKIVIPAKNEVIIEDGGKMYFVTDGEIEEIDYADITDSLPSLLDYWFDVSEFKKIHKMIVKERKGDIYIIEVVPNIALPYQKMVIYIDSSIGLEMKREVYYDNLSNPQLVKETKEYQRIGSSYLPTMLVERIYFADAVVESITMYKDIQINIGIENSVFKP
jgi:outer membrane lipoprotein-sorting protein